MQGIFITGTDTGVGKTYLVSRLAAQLQAAGQNVGVYKPACSGAEQEAGSLDWRWGDVEAHFRALGGKFPRSQICPQCFIAPLAPPAAAAEESRQVDRMLLREGVTLWREQVDLLLVEGVGGWKCPLAEGETIADLARDLGWPVIIVAANRLGVINHTLLTIESVAASGLPLLGVVLNQIGEAADESVRTNLEVLKRYGGDLPLCSTAAGCESALTEIIRWIDHGG